MKKKHKDSRSNKKSTSSKKPYQTPKLTVYGSISKLTSAKAIGGARDGQGSKKT